MGKNWCRCSVTKQNQDVMKLEEFTATKDLREKQKRKKYAMGIITMERLDLFITKKTDDNAHKKAKYPSPWA